MRGHHAAGRPPPQRVYPRKDTPAGVTKVFFDALNAGVYFPPLRGFTEIYNQINTELNVSINENKRSVRESAQTAVQAANRLLAL